jgi:leucyl/phenylalanyl-tRNA--protein transferase
LSKGDALACPEGIEPPTHSLEGCCSIQLSYGAIRFERTTLCSQSRCATRLRYAPTNCVFYRLPWGVSRLDYSSCMPKRHVPLPWLEPGDDFPAVTQAWGLDSDAPGLLAAGGQLDVSTLSQAYAEGIFPWFSAGQPILWWSPDPRMVLQVPDFRLHRSLRKTLQKFRATPGCEVRIDTAFDQVIQACASSPREGQSGTWIVPAMVQAYRALHRAGFAHSVETWVDDQLVGGLYCVALGRAVFGESMFARATDASKIALAALVCFCRAHGIPQIDCQQNTRHLASLGAREMPRAVFLAAVRQARAEPAPAWRFEPLYWQHLSVTPPEPT